MTINDQVRNGASQVRGGVGTAAEIAVTGGFLAVFVAALPVRRFIDQRKETARLRESTQFSEAEVAELRKLLSKGQNA